MNGTTLVTNGGFVKSRAPRRGMLIAALTAPWYATKRQTVWISLIVFALGCIGALVIGIFVPDARGRIVAVVAYSAGVAFVWAFWLSGMLLVARDAWRLAVPGVARNATMSALLFAAITLASPVLIEAAFRGYVVATALIVALAMAAGLAFVLLPRWIAVWLGFLPGLYGSLHDVWHLASPLQPGFLRWGGALLVLLLVPAAWRWWRLLRAASDEPCGWSSPMIFQLRKQAVTSAWAFDKQLFWRGSTRQHRFANLRGIDARTPAKAIEVALGALFVPQTLIGNLRRLSAGLWPVAAFGVALLLVNLGNMHSLHRTIIAAGIGGAMWGGMFGTMMVLFALYAMLRRRWDNGAELALLALLPGLDRRAPLYRSLVRAVFVKTLAACAALGALMVACEALAHFGAAAIALTTAVVSGTCLLAALYLLRVFAGRPVRAVVQGLVATCVFALMLASLAFVIVVALKRADAIETLVAWGVVAAWVVFVGAMAILVVRAWQTLRARPHPFLAGAR